MAKLSTCISVALLLLASGCGSQSRPVPYEDLTRKVSPLEFTRITRDVFRSRSALRDVLARNNPGRPLTLPPIDFTRRQVYLVAAGPRSSTGYALRIVGVHDEGDRIVVTVDESTPSLGDRVRARITYPFRLIVFPRSAKPVKLKWPGRP